MALKYAWQVIKGRVCTCLGAGNVRIPQVQVYCLQLEHQFWRARLCGLLLQVGCARGL